MSGTVRRLFGVEKVGPGQPRPQLLLSLHRAYSSIVWTIRMIVFHEVLRKSVFSSGFAPKK